MAYAPIPRCWLSWSFSLFWLGSLSSLSLRRFQRFHGPLAHGGYAAPVAGPDISRRAQPGTADRDHVRLSQPRRRVGLADAAGRAKPRIRKRPRQGAKGLDPAGLLGRKEFYEIKAMGQRQHQ